MKREKALETLLQNLINDVRNEGWDSEYCDELQQAFDAILKQPRGENGMSEQMSKEQAVKEINESFSFMEYLAHGTCYEAKVEVMVRKINKALILLEQPQESIEKLERLMKQGHHFHYDDVEKWFYSSYKCNPMINGKSKTLSEVIDKVESK